MQTFKHTGMETVCLTVCKRSNILTWRQCVWQYANVQTYWYEDSVFLRNAGIYRRVYMAPKPKTIPSRSTLTPVISFRSEGLKLTGLYYQRHLSWLPVGGGSSGRRLAWHVLRLLWSVMSSNITYFGCRHGVGKHINGANTAAHLQQCHSQPWSRLNCFLGFGLLLSHYTLWQTQQKQRAVNTVACLTRKCGTRYAKWSSKMNGQLQAVGLRIRLPSFTNRITIKGAVYVLVIMNSVRVVKSPFCRSWFLILKIEKDIFSLMQKTTSTLLIYLPTYTPMV
jgi:hypothetical protein